MRELKKMISSFLSAAIAICFFTAYPINKVDVYATSLQDEIYRYATKFKGKTREEVGLPEDEWCGYYADYVLKLAYRSCGYDNYRDYYPSSDMPSAHKVSQYIEDDTRWAEYYSWAEWEFAGKVGVKTDNRDSYYPEVGDILTINWFSSKDSIPEHVAIIIKVNEDGSFVTSEGNTKRDTYTRDTSPVAEYTYTKTYERFDEVVYGKSTGAVVCAVRPHDPTRPTEPKEGALQSGSDFAIACPSTCGIRESKNRREQAKYYFPMNNKNREASSAIPSRKVVLTLSHFPT
ncbi:MAG: CHAP domain-containing protein [Clostridia bacterium]|nr:CHAP domain-containing protein [Clostridia bacterium]